MTESEFQKFKRDLKVYLCGYKKVNSRLISNLELLGLKLIRSKNHCIFEFLINNKVLEFEIDKTPGDFRSGIKTACDIARIVRKEVRN